MSAPSKPAAPAPATVADVLGGKSRAPRAATFKRSEGAGRVTIPTEGEVPVFVTRGTRANGGDIEYLVVQDGTRQTGIPLDAVFYGLTDPSVLDAALVGSCIALRK